LFIFNLLLFVSLFTNRMVERLNVTFEQSTGAHWAGVIELVLVEAAVFSWVEIRRNQWPASGV